MKRLILSVSSIAILLGIFSCAFADVQFDANGSITKVGRSASENLLAEPVNMRIVERAFVAQEGQKANPNKSDDPIVVENQHKVLDGMNLVSAKRQVKRVIEDKAIAASGKLTNGYSKSVKDAQLTWTVTRQPVGDGMKLSVEFKNQANHLRSLDVEFPVALKGNDYKALFSGQNDFPDWPVGMALAYGLRDNEFTSYNGLSQPMCTLFSADRDAGITLAADYNYPILPISFYGMKSSSGTAVLVTFLRVRLDPMGSRTITLYIKPHEGDWRSGLAFIRATWPEKFMVSPKAQNCISPVFGGTGSLGNYYPGCFTEPSYFKNYLWRWNPWHRFTIEMMGLDHGQGRYMSDEPEWTAALGEKWYYVNNKADWFPKEFLAGKPDKDAPVDEIIKWMESRPESTFDELYQRGFGEGGSQLQYIWHKASYDGVREFIKTGHEHGSPMFLYWNPRDVWYPIARDKFPDQIFAREEHYFSFDAALCAPVKDSKLYNHHKEQIEKMFTVYPELDGIFIDQSYGEGPLAGYDDGWTVLDDGKTAADLNGSLAEMNKAALDIARKHGKLIWTNHGQETIDMTSNSDLVLTEDREAAGMGQEITRYMAIGNRPQMVHAFGEIFLQAALRNGAVGQTGHVVGLGQEEYDTRFKPDSQPWASRLYQPMFDLLKNKEEWCLEPHCLTLPEGFEGNLVRIDEDRNLLATVVAFGENFHTSWTRFDVPVTINVKDAAQIKAAYLVGAANLGAFKIPFERSGNKLTARIPRFKGAASVLFAKSGRFVSVDTTSPIATAGGSWSYNFVADNFTGELWNWRGTVWMGDVPVWRWEDIPAGKSASVGFTIQLPADYAKPFTKVVLAKESASRLPAEDGAEHHYSTFEFFVEKPVSLSIAPSREMVMKTVSTSAQGGYLPMHQPFPLHVLTGDVAEFTLGAANNGSTSETFTITAAASGVKVEGIPASLTVKPNSRINIQVLVRGVGRGKGSVKIDLKKADGTVAASDELQFTVIGNSLSQSDLAQVKAMSLYYDIWGSSRTDGADTKTLTLNGTNAGKLEVSGGYSTWITRVKAALDDSAKAALKTSNVINIANPSDTFWKVRNLMLAVELNDGAIVHLLSDSPAISSPGTLPWAEGKRLKPGESVEVAFR